MEETQNEIVEDVSTDVDDWSDAVNDALEEIGDKPIEDENNEANFINEIENKKEEKVVENTPVEDEFEVVYNGEKVKVTKENAIPLIQKGMNYDKLNDKYENDKARNFIKKLADREGKSIDEYIDLTSASIEQNNILEIAEEEGVSEELAREIYNSREKNRENAFANARIEEQSKVEEERNKQFNEFLENYPNVKPEEIPREVWDKFNEGMPLKHAYMEYENQVLRNENKQLKTNATNMRQEVLVGTNSNQDGIESWERIWEEEESPY